MCQYCKACGVTKGGNIVDHVLPVELFPNQMKDIDNLVTCCSNCHYCKTRFEEKYYGTGLHAKAAGNPTLTDLKLIAELTDRIKTQK